MSNRLLTSVVAALLFAVTFQSAQAEILGAGLGGALRGAIIGDLVDGRNGAAAGAVIGGLIGAGEAASRGKEQKQQSEAAQKRQAEWQAAQQTEQHRIRKQQATAVPQDAVDQTLLVESQKSLIRLGHEPGDIGVAGAELTNAVNEYQKSAGLPETGELSQELLSHMLRNGG
jgi:uncharacterized protein YcfJ